MIDGKIITPRLKTEFEKNIKKEINNIIISRMPSITKNIQARLSLFISDSIIATEEYQSILSGILRGQLGIPDPTVIDAIVNTWANEVEVKYNRAGGLGSIGISMIRADYSNVLNMPEASYVYGTREGAKIIEWLRWMLLEGNSLIVLDYEFKPSVDGRTGLGIMISREGSGWRVPSQYSGTATDNFVTRALFAAEDNIDDIVRQEITRGLQ